MGGIEGDAAIQLWHLLASLSEWAAVNEISLERELASLNETLISDDLNLPAAEGALKASLQSKPQSLGVNFPSEFTAQLSSILSRPRN